MVDGRGAALFIKMSKEIGRGRILPSGTEKDGAYTLPVPVPVQYPVQYHGTGYRVN